MTTDPKISSSAQGNLTTHQSINPSTLLSPASSSKVLLPFQTASTASLKKYEYYSHDGIVIYHADCRDILPELPRVDLVLTDPPYGISIKGSANNSPNGRRNFDFFKGDDDWKAMVELARETVLLCANLHPLTQLFWVSHRQIGKVVVALEQRDYSTRLLAWLKTCPAPTAPGAGFATAFETCVYGYKPGRAWNGSQYEFNTFSADSYRHGNANKLPHPTQKPISLFAWQLRLLSNVSDTILDPFMGSGTPLRAAKDLRRKAIGIEIEEKYCEIAAKRLSQEVFDF